MNVDKMLARHKPTPEQKSRMNSLHNFARGFAREIQSATPTGPNQRLAMRHLEDALICAHKAIVKDAQEHGGAIVDRLLRPGGRGKLRSPRWRAVSRGTRRHLYPSG